MAPMATNTHKNHQITDLTLPELPVAILFLNTSDATEYRVSAPDFPCFVGGMFQYGPQSTILSPSDHIMGKSVESPSESENKILERKHHHGRLRVYCSFRG